MNISSKIFTTDGSNFSSYLFHNGTEVEDNFSGMPVLYIYCILYFLCVLLGFPTNFYVIWLIVRGTGNGLAAEFFSLNLCVCEIFICMEPVFLFLISKLKILWIVVSVLDGLATTGRPLFQCLMCVERYLAVVHPVTFLKFKPLRYRVICCVITWGATFGSSGIILIFFMFQSKFYFVSLFAQFFLFLSIQLFCCLAVLRALKQSGPGERGRERNEENHMKRKAFHLILITTVTMLIIYAPYIILLAYMSSIKNHDTVLSIISVCYVLAGLVQPLLFLYRVGKLSVIKCQ